MNKSVNGKSFIILFIAALWVCLVVVVLGSPNIPHCIEENVAYSDTARYYIDHSIEDTGAVNVVSGIITDYRAFDTLGEVTVLFTGVTAALVTIKKNKDTEKPIEKKSKGKMENRILTIITRTVVPLAHVYGFYVILHGHLSPGGGFSGGAILGASLILTTLAFGQAYTDKILPPEKTKILESLVIILIVIVGFIGVFSNKPFLTNKASGFYMGQAGDLIGAGFIPIITIAIGIKVMTTVVNLAHLMIEEDADE